jgi:biopolymer transport protein ExbB
MASGLWAGGIAMVPLGICAIAVGAIAVERTWFWVTLWRRQGPIMDAAIAELDQPTVPPDATCQWLTEQANGPFPLVRVLRAGLTLDRPTPEEFALALETAARQEIPTIKRFQSALGTIASVAPLLGLLGTILGLMRAFATLPSGTLAPVRGAWRRASPKRWCPRRRGW